MTGTLWTEQSLPTRRKFTRQASHRVPSTTSTRTYPAPPSTPSLTTSSPFSLTHIFSTSFSTPALVLRHQARVNFVLVYFDFFALRRNAQNLLSEPCNTPAYFFLTRPFLWIVDYLLDFVIWWSSQSIGCYEVVFLLPVSTLLQTISFFSFDRDQRTIFQSKIYLFHPD